MHIFKIVFLFFLVLIVDISYAQHNYHVDSNTIVEIMQEQIVCWNNGNIDCFMQAYWKSDDLKFIGKSGITYGWSATLANYKKNYPDKTYMGNLKFDIIHIEKVGLNSMTTIGAWNLDREVGNIGGYFSLVWKRIDNQWLIVSDHSS